MLTEKQELQFYQRCQFSSHPSQATPNALDYKALLGAGYYSCVCLLHATKKKARRSPLRSPYFSRTDPPSNISAIKIKSPPTNASRLQRVCSDGCAERRAAVHTPPPLKYHFSPWREGRVEVGYRLSDVPGRVLHHAPRKMDRENTLPSQRLIAVVGCREGLTL